jgi:ketopantoate hydroxymethyltransferase
MFEGEELCYNYKSSQWTRIPAYDTYGMYTVDNNDYDIGLVVYSSGSVDLQEQTTAGVVQDGTIATGAIDLNPEGRCVVTAVRPLINGGTPTVQVGVQDNVSDTSAWTDATSVNSRSGAANFRSEGRYVRLSVTVTDDYNYIIGADVEFSPAGRV